MTELHTSGAVPVPSAPWSPLVVVAQINLVIPATAPSVEVLNLPVMVRFVTWEIGNEGGL